MAAIVVSLLAGVAIGLLYLFGTKPTVRRTVASSVLLGIFIGVLVELARRPLLAAVFAGLATIFLAEFLRWVLAGFKKRKP